MKTVGKRETILGIIAGLLVFLGLGLTFVGIVYLRSTLNGDCLVPSVTTFVGGEIVLRSLKGIEAFSFHWSTTALIVLNIGILTAFACMVSLSWASQVIAFTLLGFLIIAMGLFPLGLGFENPSMGTGLFFPGPGLYLAELCFIAAMVLVGLALFGGKKAK